MENPLEFFKKEMENENPTIKVNAISRLPVIVYSISKPESKKKEILSYLDKYLQKCELDEVVFGMARVLGDLAEFFQIDMIALLDKMLVNEETVIREAAIEAYMKMVQFVS